MLCCVLTASTVAVALQVTPVSAATSGIVTVTDSMVVTLGDEEVTIDLTLEYPESYAVVVNPSVEVMAAYNDGEIPETVYKNNGNLSTLIGSYSDYKVINPITALSSVKALDTVLGTGDVELSADHLMTRTNDNGDIYYTFEQVQDGVIIDGARFVVGTDKNGNIICFTSSIDNTLVDSGIDNMITAQQAKEVIINTYEPLGFPVEISTEPELVIYSDRYCWTFYYEVANSGFYMKAYIDANGGGVYNTVMSMTLQTDDSEGFDNDIYFTHETEDVEFTDYFGNTVTLPVAYISEDVAEPFYTVVDNERKIFIDYYANANNPDPNTMYKLSTKNDLDPIYVTVFHNMQRVYDYYKNVVGLDSISGNGMPIRIMLDYTEEGKPAENATFSGFSYGFANFTFGKFALSTPLDTTGHEFAHGVKHSLSGDAVYANGTGAIEESYADILGNLAQFRIDPDNAETEIWEIGEEAHAIRAMGAPHKFLQPEYIGDAYNATQSYYIDIQNDNGGVHINNSILSNISYKMDKQLGMSYADNYNAWYDTLYMFNPKATYDDVRLYLKHTLRRNGTSTVADNIQSLFEEANAVDADSFEWDIENLPEGVTLVIYESEETLDEDFKWAPVAALSDDTYTIGSVSAPTAGYIAVESDLLDELTLRFRTFGTGVGKIFISLDEIQHKTEQEGNVVHVKFSLKDLKRAYDEKVAQG